VLLALDTCDARGSVALLNDREILGEIVHPNDEEFSSWLLPAIDQLLLENRISHADLAGYAVASGPGSFTGVRVGLTTAKAWSEVYAKPIFSVSRLAVLAKHAAESSEYAAAFIDAQRKQVFAALYLREGNQWKLVGEESVIDPSEFFRIALGTAGNTRLSWISLDPDIFRENPPWKPEELLQASIITVRPPLASSIGLYALAHLKQKGTDALALDANYVRRSDAEIFGKKAAGI
jgi:tRNA threonylcarbamoyladenosine biosynthesis protein TsaB